MNNIIEKLGITPGPWKPVNKKTEMKLSNVESIETSTNPVVIPDDDKAYIYTNDLNLILSAPEMLSALIELMEMDDNFEGSERYLEIIEKACYPKKWSEIQELCNE